MSIKWWTLTAVCVATFMLLLDISVVNTALPAISRNLNASFSGLQWVVDAYTLALAAVVLTAGSLADRLGRRRLFAAALIVFSGASLCCGLAPGAIFLDVARAVQGVGAAGMFSVSLALIAQEFSAGRDRGTAMGLYGATIGVAVAIGPLVGGAITSWIDWRWVFFINVPIGVLALAITIGRVRESRDPHPGRVDLVGLVTLSASLLALVLALVRGNDDGWTSPIILTLLAVGTALVVMFVTVELRTEHPMLPLGLFRIPAFTGVQIAAFAVSASLFALFLYISLYMQDDLGYSPLQTGLRYLPVTMVLFVVSPLSGMLLSRVPARILIAVGLAGTGAGLLLMSGITPHSGWQALLPGLIIAGIGAGILSPAIADVALSVVPEARSGMASGVNDTFRQLGVAVGIVVWGAIYQARATTTITHAATGTPFADPVHARQLINALSSGHLTALLNSVLADQHSRALIAASTRHGFINGFTQILTIGGAVAFAGAVLALALIRERDIQRADPPDHTPTSQRTAARSPRRRPLRGAAAGRQCDECAMESPAPPPAGASRPCDQHSR